MCSNARVYSFYYKDFNADYPEVNKLLQAIPQTQVEIDSLQREIDDFTAALQRAEAKLDQLQQELRTVVDKRTVLVKRTAGPQLVSSTQTRVVNHSGGYGRAVPA
jgi:peptidoglycan hydrolase CwlO-like protein